MTRYLVRVVSYAWDPVAKRMRQSPFYGVSVSEQQLRTVMATLNAVDAGRRKRTTANAVKVGLRDNRGQQKTSG